MITDLRWHPLAIRDISEIVAYYSNISPPLVRTFEHELADILQRSQEFPLSSPSFGKSQRRACLSQFPFAMYYAVVPPVLMVVAILPQQINPRAIRTTLNCRIH